MREGKIINNAENVTQFLRRIKEWRRKDIL